MNILVTGASGFVGSHLVPCLLGDNHDVTALQRHKLSGNDSLHCVESDLKDSDIDLSKHLENIDTVIHLASLAHSMDGTSSNVDYRSLNVEGTQRLLQACHCSNVKRFVYISSVKVLGEGGLAPEQQSYNDRSSPCPVDIYGQTKLEAEQWVKSLCDEAGIDHVILRPPLVYGPGVRANFLSLLSIVRKKIPLPLASIQNRRSLVYVNNLCNMIQRCIEFDGRIEDTFLVSDTEVSTPELISEIAHQMQIKPMLFPCPPELLGILADISRKQSAYNRLAGSLIIDSSRYREKFNWTPPCSFKDGIRETAEWYMSTI